MNNLVKLIKDLKGDYFIISSHVRHIIEHYRALLQCHFSNSYEMSYESKDRDFDLEKESHYAIHTLKHIQEISKMITLSRTVKVDGMTSTLGRELRYCMDHQVHHEAIIRTILQKHGKENLIDEEFGVAKSTLAYRNGTA